MDIGVMGISYKSSELSFREVFTRSSHEFLRANPFLPMVLLSTCNRTEIYFSSSDLTKTYSYLLTLFEEEGDFEQRLYCYFGSKCFEHLAKVTCGLDSALFGEAEIQGQVRRSYEKASFRKLPFPLHYLFQKSLKIGKEMRNQFSLPKGLVSLESTLWELSQCFFSQKKPISLLLIGYSEINRLIISFFKKKQIFIMQLATRRSQEELFQKCDIPVLSFDQIDSWVDFDMVISASHSSEYLLNAKQIPEDLSLVKTRLVVDLSLPRNVDPLIEKNPLITLFNIEEVNKFIEEKQQMSLEKQKYIQDKVEELVTRQTALYFTKKKRMYVCA